MKNNMVKAFSLLSIVALFILVSALSSCAMLGISSAKRVEDFYLEAEALYHSGNYNAAIEKYKIALKEFGKPGVGLGIRPHINAGFPARVNFGIAKCYFKPVEDFYLEAEALHRSGNYNAAIKKYKIALEEFGKLEVPPEIRPYIDAGLLLRVNSWIEAEALYRSGNYNAAIKKHKIALEEFGKPGVVLGILPHIDAGFLLRVNSRITECYVKRVEDFYLEAEALYRSGNYNAAIKKYKIALEEFGKPGVVLGILPHIDAGFLLRVNSRITECYVKRVEDFYLEAEALYRSGNYNAAIEKYKIALEEFGKPGVVLGILPHIDAGFPARVNFGIAKCYFKPVEDFYLEAEALHRSGNYNAAIEKYKIALEEFGKLEVPPEIRPHIDADFPALINYNIASSYSKLAQRPRSKNLYSKVIVYCELALRKVKKQSLKTEIQSTLVEAHFIIGKAHFEKKDYESALSHYQLALQNTQKYPLKTEIQSALVEAHFIIGKAHFEKKDYESALSHYQLALQNTQKYPLKTEIQLSMAFAYLNHGNAKNAMATCKRILLGAKIGRERMLKANSLTRERLTIAEGIQFYLEAENTTFLAGYKGATLKYNAALIKIQRSISATTGAEYRADLNYILGYLFYKVERFESAEQQLTKVIDDFPDSNFVDDAWYAIGDMNYKLQSYLGCRSAFRKILENFPSSDLRDDAQYFIAKSLLEELSYERAYLAFDELTTKVFQIYPDFQDDARYHAAYCLNLLSRDDMAIRRYQNFLAHYPNSPYRVDAYFDLGAVYARQKDYDKARSNYALAMQHTDDQALLSEIQMAIGHAYYNQRDYRNAIVAHTLFLEKYPESGFIIEAKLGIANSHFRMRAWQEAADAYERVINEHPEAINFTPYCAYQIGEAHYGLAIDYNDEQGKTEYPVENYHKALNWYQKIIDNIPTETSDNLSEVVELLVTSLTRMRNDLNVPEELQSLAQLKKGDSYLTTKQYGKALTEYNTFVQVFPNSTRAVLVQNRIKQVQEYIISKNLQREKVRTIVEVPIAQQIAQKALASTVLISIKDATGDPMAIGSGFFINKDQIVSNWHVVEDATTAYAMSVDEGTRYNIEGIIAMNPKQDLVILKVSGKGSPLPLGSVYI